MIEQLNKQLVLVMFQLLTFLLLLFHGGDISNGSLVSDFFLSYQNIDSQLSIKFETRRKSIFSITNM